MAALNYDDYYPNPAHHPALRALPRVGRSNNIQDFYMTEKTIEDRVRALPEFQGLNELQMWGLIQNEIDKWRSDRVGLGENDGQRRVNKAQGMPDN